VARHAGVDLAAYPSHDIEIRGRSEMVRVRVVVEAEALPLGAV
jgi:hypothetical protein